MNDQDGKEFIERFTVRMPTGMREQVAKIAEHNGRSMNSEVIQILQDAIDSFNNPKSSDENEKIIKVIDLKLDKHYEKILQEMLKISGEKK